MKKDIKDLKEISDNDIVKIKKGKLYKVEREFDKVNILSNSEEVYLSTNIYDALLVGKKDSMACYGSILLTDNADCIIKSASHLINSFILSGSPDDIKKNVVFILRNVNYANSKILATSFMSAASKYSKQYGIKIFIRLSTYSKSTASTIVEKYNNYVKQYLELSAEEKRHSAFYMISAKDYLNYTSEQIKISSALNMLLMSKNSIVEDIVKTVRSHLSSFSAQHSKKDLKALSEMIYIQEYMYRAYRLSVFLESEIFCSTNNNSNILEKGIAETKARREYEKKIRMLNIVKCIWDKKGRN